MATSVLQLQPEEQTLRKLKIAEYHKLVELSVGLYVPLLEFNQVGAMVTGCAAQAWP